MQHFNALTNVKTKIAAGVAALAAAGAANAGPLATAVETGVDTTELLAIGLVVMTVVGIILLIRSSRKAAT